MCASIVEENQEKVIQTVKQITTEELGYIELRLDTIKDINSEKATKIIKTIKEITSIPIILTNRTPKEGGYFKGTEQERIKILEDNAPLVEITDIELMTETTLRQKVINKANKTIISYHNFQKTPTIEKLQELVNQATKIGDIPKIAVQPNTKEDTYTLIKLIMQNNGIIGISMGKLGAYTRIMAPIMGSPVTYASITKESAPGQYDIKTTNELIKKLQQWLKMNTEEKTIIKTLNKIGVDTRFISLYKDNIYINNLKFSKFSRKKEEEFHELYPQINIIRSKIFQKICIKVSRTVKNQIKPRQTLYIKNDESIENILLYILLEPYKRKYGIKITDKKEKEHIIVSNNCLDDFTIKYIDLMTNAEQITNKLEENRIYPLTHVPHQWITDWATTNNINYKKTKKYDETISNEIINFLEKHIPNVQESIIQSVNYLDENNNKR